MKFRNLHRSFSVAFLFMATAATVNLSVAQDNKAQKVDAVTYSKEPLELTAGDQAVPLGFQGNNVKAIYEALQQKVKPKDEFETTADYQKRVADAATKPILGSLQANSLMSVVVDASSTYNADVGTSEIKFSLSSPPILISDYNNRADEGVVEFSRRLLEKSTYTATNGFGAKAEVLKTEYEIYGVFLDGWKQIKLQPAFVMEYIEPEAEGRFVIPMSVDIAKAAKSHLKALVSFTLHEPYSVKTYDFGGKTTIQNPYDTTYNVYLLRGTVQDVVFFNENDGQIVYRAEKQ